ncbi:serine/arginine repetitive matrix protein 2-like [Tigriopus californicus]|nr:serine/arginine repetitive matrix protein 2-like [Tigriopus californicus]
MSLASPRQSHSPVPMGSTSPRTMRQASSKRVNTVSFAPGSPSLRVRLQRQFSTNRPDSGGESRHSGSAGSPRTVRTFKSRSADQTCSSGLQMDHHHRTNSFPNRQAQGAGQSSVAKRPSTVPSAFTRPVRMRQRPKPPPLNIGSAMWDSGHTSETDCSVASSTSPPRSSSTCDSQSSPGSISPARQRVSPKHSPNRSPRSASSHPSHYFALPPLSPIPHSPQPPPPNSSPLPPIAQSPSGRSRLSPKSPRSPRSPCSPYSPRAMSPVPPQSPGSYRSPSPGPTGNFARLASRRRSHAALPSMNMRRRTSNFLELPVADYQMRQRRYCSLPENGYNPRNEIYKLRAFSISPKGALIKHGDQLASRRSRSSAGSTANTSRTPSRCGSPQTSRPGSRDVSPLPRSPVGTNTNSAAFSPKSQWSTNGSSQQSSFVEDEPSSLIEAVPEEDEEEVGVAGPETTTIKYRVAMLGDNGTGKTALVSQFLTSEYMNTYDASLDEEFGERSVSVVLDGEESEMVCIDHTNGEMSVENTLSTYEPHACVVIYSVVDAASFATAEDILGYLWRIGFCDSQKATVILVGNKVDLERSRIIYQDAGKKLAVSYGAKFIETSVGIQHNVDELLVGILKQIRLHQTMDRKRKASKPTSSPLHTLQVARDILSRVCINAKQASFTKSCENLHVL